MALTAEQSPEQLLNAAFAKAQGEFPTITKDKSVDTGTFKYKYATLETILSSCRPILAKHGLAITQLLEQNGNGRPSIRTELRHAGGGVVGSSFPLPTVPDSPQKLGSLLTYLRRYALVALLGIATEDDDDGQAAGAAPVERGRTGMPPTEPREQPPPTGPLLTPAQRNMLFALFDKSEFTDRESRLAFATTMLGRRVTTSNELTVDEASRLIQILEEHQRRRQAYEREPEVPFGELPEDY